MSGRGPDQTLERERAAAAIGTRERVAFLSCPATHGGGDVLTKETHKSFVFLTGSQVYKLKKPVENHFQDLTTVEARRDNTLTEIGLNRRLADEIYLGPVALTLESDGSLALDGDGPAIDWLVHMKRVPEAVMLDHMIAAGRVTPEAVERLVELLADFYGRAAPVSVDPAEHATMFQSQQAENRRVAELFGDRDIGLAAGELARLLDGFDAAFAANRAGLQERVRDGRILEGHGDLRPEHVCLLDPPVVIDCLEFSRRLRLVDPYDELGFLAMECAVEGADWIGPRLLGGIGARIGHRPPASLSALYRAYRALLRARLCLAHLLEPEPREPAKWRPKARAYMGMAASALSIPASREDRK